MIKVFQEIGIDKIIGCCTDKAAYMKKAWDLLYTKYEDKLITFYGCSAHILNLLINDTVKLNTASELINNCKSIVKDIKNKSVLSKCSVFKFTKRKKEEDTMYIGKEL